MKNTDNPSSQILIEYTSCALRGKDYLPMLEKAKNACEKHGFDFGIQIHNTTSLEQLQEYAGLNIPLTFHAPILSEHLINLASEDFSPAKESIKITVEWMRKLNVSLAVFHGFIMTDKPVLAFNQTRSYDKCFRQILRPELGLDGSEICGNFFETQEFKDRLKRVRDRLTEIKNLYPDLLFVIENDFPLYGSGLLLSEHIKYIDLPMCIDTGHLWAASYIYDRSFLEEAEKIVLSGNVRLVHLHASTYTAETPKIKWRDGHKSLLIKNNMGLKQLVLMCRNAGVRHFTFETVYCGY